MPTWVPPTPEAQGIGTRDSERAPESERAAETDHFELYTPDGQFPAAVPDLPDLAETILGEVSARLGPLGEEPQKDVQVTFLPPSSMPCPPRGLAATRPPRIFIYADDETSREQILGVLAHELGHILIMNRFRDIPRALNEGLATWASAPYFNRWQEIPSLDTAVRSYLQDSTYLPLHENYYLTGINPGAEEGSSESCITRRETLYIEWASFLDYMIEWRGMDKLEELTETVPDAERSDGEIIIKPADFEAVYGSSLNQLEAAWLHHLLDQ